MCVQVEWHDRVRGGHCRVSVPLVAQTRLCGAKIALQMIEADTS